MSQRKCINATTTISHHNIPSNLQRIPSSSDLEIHVVVVQQPIDFVAGASDSCGFVLVRGVGGHLFLESMVAKDVVRYFDVLDHDFRRQRRDDRRDVVWSRGGLVRETGEGVVERLVGRHLDVDLVWLIDRDEVLGLREGCRRHYGRILLVLHLKIDV